MKRIGLFDAKTNLSKIAERVKRTGESVTLTRRGEPVVDLVPHSPPTAQRKSKAQVIKELAKIRQNFPKSDLAQIKADINEGRR